MEDKYVAIKQPCLEPDCLSSDAKAYYTDGGSKCFSCGTVKKNDPYEGEASPQAVSEKVNLVNIVFKNLTARKIPANACKKYAYGVGTDKYGEEVEVACYYNSNKVRVAQKLRYKKPKKDFRFIGKAREVGFFGQQLWSNTGNILTITEGEIDCLSVATAFDLKYPVVSLKNGISSAKKELTNMLSFLDGYKEIVLWFDNDEAGNKGVKEALEVLPLRKVKIVRHPKYKDANEVLVAEGKAGIIDAFYKAESYQSEALKKPTDYLEEIVKPPQQGFPYFSEELTDKTMGRRYGELVLLGGGSGLGKTEIVLENTLTDLKAGRKVGLILLEQKPSETIQRLVGKEFECIYHIADHGNDMKRLTERAIELDELITFHDHFGKNSWQSIKQNMLHMIAGGTKIFYIDPLTAIVAGEDKERKEIDIVMSELSAMVNSHDLWVMLTSHLTRHSGDDNHNEGGLVKTNQLAGSRGTERWANTILGLVRNVTDPDLLPYAHITVLKDRFSGRGFGQTIGLKYNSSKGVYSDHAVVPLKPEKGKKKYEKHNEPIRFTPYNAEETIDRDF